MVRELQFVDSFEGSIAADATETLEVKTAISDEAQMLIDDGTTSQPPKKYDLEELYFVPEVDDFISARELVGKTARQVQFDTRGARLRVNVTNASGQAENYRIVLQSFTEV